MLVGLSQTRRSGCKEPGVDAKEALHTQALVKGLKTFSKTGRFRMYVQGRGVLAFCLDTKTLLN